MAPGHIREDVDKQKSKEALQSPSPLAALKACNMIHAHGIAYSKIVITLTVPLLIARAPLCAVL